MELRDAPPGERDSLSEVISAEIEVPAPAGGVRADPEAAAEARRDLDGLVRAREARLEKLEAARNRFGIAGAVYVIALFVLAAVLANQDAALAYRVFAFGAALAGILAAFAPRKMLPPDEERAFL